jgi:hypothetical protein
MLVAEDRNRQPSDAALGYRFGYSHQFGLITLCYAKPPLLSNNPLSGYKYGYSAHLFYFDSVKRIVRLRSLRSTVPR